MKLINQKITLQEVYIPVFIGLFLRLFEINKDAFWFDELGVLQAANQISPFAAINISHQHVMAMPLHYLLVWFYGKVFTTTTFIRIPEALFGTLSIYMGYKVARFYVNHWTSLLCSWLIALSPILIMYSQELRFYAGLVFFYLTSIYFGIMALTKNRTYYYLLFIVIGIIGITYHVYCILAIMNIVAYYISNRDKIKGEAYKKFLYSIILLLLIFIIFLLFFGKLSPNQENIFKISNTWQFFFMGTGLIPPFLFNYFDYIYSVFMIVFGIFGVISLFESEQRFSKIFLIFSIIIQAIIVYGMNIIKNYFIAPRQLIFLAPLTMIFVGLGINYVTKIIHDKLLMLESISFLKFQWIFLFITIIVAVPTLIHYYRLEKGVIWSGMNILKREWSTGQTICILPKLDSISYIYYWNKEFNYSIKPVNTIDELVFCDYALTDPNINLSTIFTPIFIPDKYVLYPKIIWIKNSIK